MAEPAQLVSRYDVPPPFGRVRRGIWALLIVSLVLAVAAPTVTLLHAAATTLEVRASLWPATPAADTTAEVRVEVLNTADRTALHGPWGRISAEWDMLTMTMGRQHVEVPGEAGHNGTFSVPVFLSMAGPWWARVSVSTPGRPTWQAQLVFSVRPAPASQTDRPSSGAMAHASVCVAAGGIRGT